MRQTPKPLNQVLEILAFHFPAIFTGSFAVLVLSPFATGIPKYKVYSFLWLFLFMLPVGFIVRAFASRLSLVNQFKTYVWRVLGLTAVWVSALVVSYFLTHAAVWSITGYRDGPLPLDSFALKVIAKVVISLLPFTIISCIVLSFFGSFLIRKKQLKVQSNA